MKYTRNGSMRILKVGIGRFGFSVTWWWSKRKPRLDYPVDLLEGF